MTQSQEILELLSDGKFHTNYELNRLSFRYAARLHELKKKGYKFESIHNGSCWEWRLMSDEN